MLDPYTAELEMLKPGDLRITEPPPGKIIAFGTQEQMEDLARRVRVGNKTLDKRAARRSMQKASRRRNR